MNQTVKLVANKYSEILGQRIRWLRKVRGMTAQDLSLYSGVKAQMIIHLETGAYKKPSIYEIISIAKSLEVEVDEIINPKTRLDEKREDKFIVRQYRRLWPKNKEVVSQMIEEMYTKQALGLRGEV